MITGRHYQNAYICDDIEAAITLFHARAEFDDVPIIDIEQSLWTPAGVKRVVSRLAFIWIGDLQYELIQPIEDESGIYGNYKSNGGLLHFHHVCSRVPEWESFRAAVDKQDLPVVLERATEGDPLKFLYLDGRSFCGHYLEYVWATDERWVQMGGR